MSIPPALLQFAGSLLAVLLVSWLVYKLGLGPQARFANEADARRAAEETANGFVPVDVALDKQGRGALLRDVSGQIMLLRPHGTFFAGRLLGTGARAIQEGTTLVVDTGERFYGAARLQLADAQIWAQAIEAIQER